MEGLVHAQLYSIIFRGSGDIVMPRPTISNDGSRNHAESEDYDGLRGDNGGDPVHTPRE